MPEDGVVTTGVDALIDLVKKKKRISMEDAAKQLQLPLTTIEAWAAFLEEEDEIMIEYKFTTPYLLDSSLNAALQAEKIKKNTEFLAIATFISDAQQSVRQKNLIKAKTLYGEALNKMHKVHSAISHQASQIEPEKHGLLKQKFDQIAKGLDSVEASIRKGNEELAKKAMKTVSGLISRAVGELAVIKAKVSITEKRAHQLQESREVVGEKKVPGEAGETEEDSDISALIDREIMGAGRAGVMTGMSDITHAPGQPQIIQEALPDEQVTRVLSTEQQAAPPEPPKPEPEMPESEEAKEEPEKKEQEPEQPEKEEEETGEEGKKPEPEPDQATLIKLAYDAIKKGDYEKAKEHYARLKGMLAQMPPQRRAEREELRSHLIKLSRNLEFMFEQRFSKDAKSQAEDIRRRIAAVSELLRKGRTEEAQKQFESIEHSLEIIPGGFLELKTELEGMLLKVEDELIRKKKEDDAMLLAEKSKVIISLIAQAKGNITRKSIKEAHGAYLRAKKAFGELPGGFIRQKIALQSRLMDVYREMVLAEEQTALKDMKLLYDRLSLMIAEAKSMLFRGSIEEASKKYQEVKALLSSLPEGFIEEKSTLQDAMIHLEEQIILSRQELASGKVNTLAAKIRELLKMAQEYLGRKQFDLAKEIISEMSVLYQSLPDGFFERKAELHAQLMDISKRLMIEHDVAQLGEHPLSAKETYNSMLKLIVTYHKHLEAGEFNLLEVTYLHIINSYNELPIGFAMQNTRIREEIMNIRAQVTLLHDAMHLADLQAHGRQEEAQALLAKLRRTYYEVEKNQPQAAKLLKHVQGLITTGSTAPTPLVQAHAVVSATGTGDRTATLAHHEHDKNEWKSERKNEGKSEGKNEEKRKEGEQDASGSDTFHVKQLREHVSSSVSSGNFEEAINDLKRLAAIDSEHGWERRMVSLMEDEILKKKKEAGSGKRSRRKKSKRGERASQQNM